MMMLRLIERIDQLAMENSIRWYGQMLRKAAAHVLRREDAHIMAWLNR